MTKKSDIKNTDFVEFINKEHIAFIKKLKEEKGSDIWLIGGGQANSLVLNARLLDEIHVFIMPIVLSGGIDLFDAFPKETHLRLFETVTFESGAVGLKYKVEHPS